MIHIERSGSYRAGLYIRLSKEDENQGLSESVNNQKSLLDAFVKEQRLSVFATYIDDGWSGTNFDRPAFQRLLADIEAKKVNLVITKDLSRLGRDYILTGHYMERYFPERQVRYISLLDGIDTGVESAANEITPFRAIMNDMYAKDISKKIKSVKRDKQQKGLFIGGKAAYGYQKHPTEKNKIIVDEKAAAVVRRIFSMALDGLSCRQIAAALNAEGVPSPAAYAGLTVGNPGPYTGLWSSERICELLQNEIYLGNMVQGRSKKISYKSQKSLRLAPQDWVVVEGTHEPLVTEQEFQKAGQLLESRRRTRSRSYDFPLKGLVHCRDCGYPLGVINRKKSSGEDCLYFVCRTYQRFTKAGLCTCHSIRVETVSEAVIAKLREVCEAYLSTQELLSLARQTVEEALKAESCENELIALRAKLESLTTHLDKMYTDKLNGLLDEADFTRIYLRNKTERKALEEKEKALRQHKDAPIKHLDLAKTLTDRFLSDIGGNRELLVSLIERIDYSEDRQLDIRFRFPPWEALS